MLVYNVTVPLVFGRLRFFHYIRVGKRPRDSLEHIPPARENREDFYRG